MKKPTFYEQLGIVIPGAVFLFGLIFFFPALRDVLAKDGVSVGQLGIYVLLSYAAGNLVAACGNVGENLLWRFAGGMPSDWVVKPQTGLLSEQQRDLVESRLRARLGIEITSLRGLDKKTWWPISRQIYSDVARHGKPDRIDTFNGNYGLNRGLSSACFLLALVAGYRSDWQAFGLLGALTIVYAFRVYRFGVHYGRELYLQFLTIPDKTTKAPVAKKATRRKAE